jgi:diaminohydroxyphosphoribosylaminopyrimidine deaminase/5-amino-6-(5-phosphoribosylamino)uracil reductase
VSAVGIVFVLGAVLVAGGPDAVVVALAVAGDGSRGASLYCTLEPCSHTGRSPPCVERIVRAGIRRVVVAVEDVNPRVAGRGLAFLREHGVTVALGAGRAQALRQHAAFFTWVARHRPYVTLKAAMASDGSIGSRRGRVRITGEAANRFFHRQRAEVDAIAVGARTVIADDPLLTARGIYRYRPLTRVVFDWTGRVGPDARLFSTLAGGPVIMVMSAEAARAAAGRFAPLAEGVMIQPFETRRLLPVLEWLAGRDLVTLLVEGGALLHRAFLDEHLADRIQIALTPRRRDWDEPVPGALDAFLTRPPLTDRTLGADRLLEFDVHGTD